MALPVLLNRARMTTATAGTGTITLGSAVTGYATFAEAGISDGQKIKYTIEDGNDFEVGEGTYTTAGTTLSRDTVHISKIAGVAGTTKLTLSGTATVFTTFAKEHYLKGTDTNDAAAAGYIGEYLSDSLALGSATSLTTNTAKTVISKSFTAGDWLVGGTVGFSMAATTSVSDFQGSLSETTNTLDSTLDRYFRHNFSAFVPGAVVQLEFIGPAKFSLSATTTLYLIARCAFTVSTVDAYGIIWGRRVR